MVFTASKLRPAGHGRFSIRDRLAEHGSARCPSKSRTPAATVNLSRRTKARRSRVRQASRPRRGTGRTALSRRVTVRAPPKSGRRRVAHVERPRRRSSERAGARAVVAIQEAGDHARVRPHGGVGPGPERRAVRPGAARHRRQCPLRPVRRAVGEPRGAPPPRRRGPGTRRRGSRLSPRPRQSPRRGRGPGRAVQASAPVRTSCTAEPSPRRSRRCRAAAGPAAPRPDADASGRRGAACRGKGRGPRRRCPPPRACAVARTHATRAPVSALLNGAGGRRRAFGSGRS